MDRCDVYHQILVSRRKKDEHMIVEVKWSSKDKRRLEPLFWGGDGPETSFALARLTLLR